MTHLEKLKQLGVYDWFCRNIEKYSTYSSIEQYDAENKFHDYFDYVTDSFEWRKTNEGWVFWKEVAEGRTPPISKLENLVREVSRMRDLQKEYFTTMSPAILAESKGQEYVVDAMIAELTSTVKEQELL